MACKHKRSPLFTTDYCDVCDAPQLQLPIPEYEHTKPTPTVKHPTGLDVDVNDCNQPFDIASLIIVD